MRSTLRLFPASASRVVAVCLSAGLLAGCGDKKSDKPAPAQGAAPAQAASGPLALAGAWRITSATDPTGKSFTNTGTVDMTQTGAAWDLAWKLTNGTTQKGVGIDLGGGVLAVGWGGTQAFGVVVYDVAGGTLTGKWAQTGVAGLGSEVLTGPPGVSGKYTITSGKTAAGASYAGSVTITPNGELYDIVWSTGDAPQRGVAKLEGNQLVAGWGVAGGAGFARYRLTAPNRLDGVWAPVGGAKTSIEILER